MAGDEKTGTEIWEAAGEVRELASDIIAHHHPHLADAEIVYLMRSPTSKSKGRLVLGTAKKASPEHKALYAGGVDFIVTLAGAEWQNMTNRQRRALLDHELCHCVGDSDAGWALRGHDVEEFGEIIERHGLWHGELETVGETVRQLDFNGVLDDADRVLAASPYVMKGKRSTPVEGETTMTFSAMGADGRPIGEPVTVSARDFDRVVDSLN